MQSSDVAAVVDLQVEFMDGSVLTDLGHRFLDAFQRAALSHAATHAFVAVVDGATIGAAIGSLDVEQFKRHVRPRILLPLASALVAPRRWRVIVPLARSLSERGPKPSIPAELLTLVVHGSARQRGVGRALIDALERSFAAAGALRYRVAVRSHLGVARAFYQSTGFRFEQELPVLGQPMTYLTKDVPAPVQ